MLSDGTQDDGNGAWLLLILTLAALVNVLAAAALGALLPVLTAELGVARRRRH